MFSDVQVDSGLRVAEQRGLRREERPGEAAARWDADVVLGADAVTQEKRCVARWRLPRHASRHAVALRS